MENKLNELEQNLYNYIEEKSRYLTYKQLKRTFHMNSEIEQSQLEKVLANLCIKGLIYENENNEYILFSKDPTLAIGELRSTPKNKAYVVFGKTNIVIDSKHLNNAIAGDIVVIKRNNYAKNAIRGKGTIKRILKRNKPNIIFDYIDGELIPYSWPFPIKIKIANEDKKNFFEGARVLISVSLEKDNDEYIGNFKTIIGHKDDPDLDIKTIMSEYGIDFDFTKEALEQTNNLPDHVSLTEIKERLAKPYSIDLRNKNIFTIDSLHTKDIDDAVSIEKLDNGNYLLGVHIADVSHYIKKNTPLDLDAKTRSTSFYPYNYVVPMLPHKLSNGLCSLNANVDRLALSCLMEITQQGDIIDFQLLDSIIRSKKKMTYEAINDIFERHIEHKDYNEYKYDLALMLELSEILNKAKNNRGYISFGNSDIDFEDDKGVPISIKKAHRGLAENLIENFMLCANESIATFTYYCDIPAIYRVHDEPDIDKIKELIKTLHLPIKLPKNINPKSLQGIIKQIEVFDEGNVYRDFLLQLMKRAKYSPDNIGHFGLAYDQYTHFTSPIRRYMDLNTHRIIRQIRDDILSINEYELYDELKSSCQYASIRERTADDAERKINSYKMAEYMNQHINESFEGYITFINNHGITIKTENLIIGKIPYEVLKEKGFKFNEKHLSIKNYEQELFIGDKIEIACVKADKETGKIEFSLIKKIDKVKKKRAI